MALVILFLLQASFGSLRLALLLFLTCPWRWLAGCSRCGWAGASSRWAR